MHKEDIKTLIEYVVEQIGTMSADIKADKLNKVIVKNTLENLRSILDYLAQDVLSDLEKKVTTKLPEKNYFPYGQKENHFKNSIKRNLPSIKEFSPNIYICLENIQPFKSKNNWLVDLCELTNEAKHNNLTKTQTHKTMSVNQPGLINIQGASNITLSNNRINGVLQDELVIENGEMKSFTSNAGNTIVTQNNKILFHGKQIEIIPFIEHCTNEIKTLTSTIYKLIE